MPDFYEEHKKTLIFLGLTILFCISVGAGFLLHSFSLGSALEKSREIREETSLDNKPKKQAEDRAINFLILGVDERDGDFGRSDTMMIASVNFAKRRVGLIAIPRDTLVTLPTHGETKVNHAYAYGGELLSKQVAEKITNVKINHYICVNFSAFKRFIDSIGGVDLDVEKDMYYRDDYDGKDGFTIDLKKGRQHLDADKAIQYVRFRDDEGDIGRIKRQQKFMETVLLKVVNPKIVANFPNILRACGAMLKTDVSFGDMLGFLKLIEPGKTFQVRSMLLQGEPQMIDDLSYWVTDKPSVEKQLVSMNDFMVQDNPDAPVKEEKKESIFAQGNPSDLDSQIADLDKLLKENESAKEALLRAQEEEREAVRREREREAMLAQRRPRNFVKNGVVIINTTKDASLVDRAISYIEDSDLQIGMVSEKGTGAPNPKTLFIVGKNDADAIAAMHSFPFRFSVIYRNHSEQPTLIIGDDFT